MSSPKRHVLTSLLFILKCFSKSFVIRNVICATQIMSVLLPDTYTNVLVNTTILLSENTQHGNKRAKIHHLFKVLKKFRSKFDCLIYEMLFIKDMKLLSTPKVTQFAPNVSLGTFVFFSIGSFCFTLGIIPIGHTNILLF